MGHWDGSILRNGMTSERFRLGQGYRARNALRAFRPGAGSKPSQAHPAAKPRGLSRYEDVRHANSETRDSILNSQFPFHENRN